MTEKDKERFFKKIKQENLEKCWGWTSAIAHNGYGQFWIDGKLKQAHRVSYEIFKGKIPEGLCVLHTCDNPPCVNPNHLWLGTYKDNNTDRAKKGRSADTNGEKNSHALPVVLISPEGKEYKLSCYAPFCKKRNLSKTAICCVLRGQRNHHKGWTGKYVGKPK